MIKELEMIKTLKLSPVTDKKRDKEEAKTLVKKYFREDEGGKYNLLTLTHRENLRLDKKGWIKEAKEFPPCKFKIRKIKIQSGCMAVVEGELLIDENVRTIKIGLVRESDPYSPDPESPYLIVGTTVPPYIAV